MGSEISRMIWDWCWRSESVKHWYPGTRSGFSYVPGCFERYSLSDHQKADAFHVGRSLLLHGIPIYLLDYRVLGYRAHIRWWDWCRDLASRSPPIPLVSLSGSKRVGS